MPYREIQSFVRRPGRLTPAQKRALTELAPRFCIAPDTAPIDPDITFSRRAPLMVEIGFGNGDSLTELAASMPDWNVIGIEVHEPGVGHCLLKAESHGLEHFKIIAQDAIIVLRERLGAGSVSRLNLYFPDPWPKKRHHKRRIVNPPFMELAHHALSHDGALHIATDWAPYAEHIDEVLAADDRFDVALRRTHVGDAPHVRPPTKFEQRGLRLGHQIVDWEIRRSS
ncbi:MAG: tRNA (guanosine(46)-N7)-methyltransferase TrmB [Pseudomonadota bacterium]